MKERCLEDFSVRLRASHEDKSIQAVDFISWAIFRKYEMGDSQYYDIVKSRIHCEKKLLL